jgi:hypothetical protein
MHGMKVGMGHAHCTHHAEAGRGGGCQMSFVVQTSRPTSLIKDYFLTDLAGFPGSTCVSLFSLGIELLTFHLLLSLAVKKLFEK